MKTLYILLMVFFLMGMLKILNEHKPENEKQFEMNKKLNSAIFKPHFNAL